MSNFINLLNSYNTILTVLFAIMLLDFLSGFLKAIINKNIKSALVIQGIFKKTGEIIVILLSLLLQLFTSIEITDLVIAFMFGYEGISVLENCGEIGVPIPNFLKNKLENLKDTETEVLKNDESK